MTAIHRINLSSAWRPPAETGGAWVRRFGRPAGLEAGDRIWLVARGAGPVGLECNGVVLPAAAEAAAERRHDITPLLRQRNELVLVPAPGGSSAGAARLAGPLAAGDHRPLEPGLGSLHLEIVSEPSADGSA